MSGDVRIAILPKTDEILLTLGGHTVRLNKEDLAKLWASMTLALNPLTHGQLNDLVAAQGLARYATRVLGRALNLGVIS